LAGTYGPDHKGVIYEAAVYPVCEPVIHRLPLAGLPEAQITEVSTLYIPPKGAAPLDRDMMTRLGLETAKADRENVF
jgi:hypothetical protein